MRLHRGEAWPWGPVGEQGAGLALFPAKWEVTDFRPSVQAGQPLGCCPEGVGGPEAGSYLHHYGTLPTWGPFLNLPCSCCSWAGRSHRAPPAQHEAEQVSFSEETVRASSLIMGRPTGGAPGIPCCARDQPWCTQS